MKRPEATGGRSRRGSTRACCLVSQVLEEMGLDDASVRGLRKQALQGAVTFLQWQLARIREAEGEAASARETPTDGSAAGASHGEPDPAPRRPRGRRVKVEGS